MRIGQRLHGTGTFHGVTLDGRRHADHVRLRIVVVGLVVEQPLVVDDVVHAGGPAQRRPGLLFAHRHAHVLGLKLVNDARPVLELLAGVRTVVQAVGDFGDDLWLGFELGSAAVDLWVLFEVGHDGGGGLALEQPHAVGKHGGGADNDCGLLLLLLRRRRRRRRRLCRCLGGDVRLLEKVLCGGGRPGPLNWFYL